MDAYAMVGPDFAITIFSLIRYRKRRWLNLPWEPYYDRDEQYIQIIFQE